MKAQPKVVLKMAGIASSTPGLQGILHLSTTPRQLLLVLVCSKCLCHDDKFDFTLLGFKYETLNFLFVFLINGPIFLGGHFTLINTPMQ